MLSHPKSVLDHYVVDVLQPAINMVAPKFDRQSAELAKFQIASYVPQLNPAVGWLPVVGSRIRKSIPPAGIAPSAEWLDLNAASAALQFFNAAADLLPGEPYIYATHSGDLVAEFEAETANLTAVISQFEVILFASAKNASRPPKDHIIKNRSNLREEVRAFTSEF